MNNKKLKIEQISLNQIKPYKNNAKKHPQEQVEQIKQSIIEFGFNDPIAIWHDEIVEGHGRYLAAKQLKLKTVPIIRLDSLSNTQRKAYTLVHNQLTLNSKVDNELLNLELEDLEIDMEQFGFEIPELDLDDGWYGDERERTNRAYNLDIVNPDGLTHDFWQMPIIKKTTFIPDDLIGFNYAKTYKTKKVGIHFFIDDYQFERIWNSPEKYIDILSEYECILTPDFSLYMDMPMPIKIWNIYRSRQIGAFYQGLGITVIPTISWAEPETFKFCFKGIEKNSIIAISTMSIKKEPEAKKIWEKGMKKMISEIEPETILVYGGKVDFDFRNTNVIYYKNNVLEKWKEGV